MDFVPNEQREELEEVLQRKPVRTASGVSPIAIMTSPKRCPHGKCLYCPGGPDSEFSSSQSYTGHEPAAARAGSRTTTTLRPGDAAAQPVTTDRSPRRQGRVDPHGRDDDRPIARLPGVVRQARAGGDERLRRRRAARASQREVSFAQDPDEYDFRYLEDVVAENEDGRRAQRRDDVRDQSPTGATPNRSTGCSTWAGRRSRSASRRRSNGSTGRCTAARHAGLHRRQPPTAGLRVQGRLPHDARPARDEQGDVPGGFPAHLRELRLAARLPQDIPDARRRGAPSPTTGTARTSSSPWRTRRPPNSSRRLRT